MFNLYLFLVRALTFFQLFTNSTQMVQVFAGTHWLLMYAWFTLAPLSQYAFFLFGRDLVITATETVMIGLVAVIEIIALFVVVSYVEKNKS